MIRLIGLGPGTADALPVGALEALQGDAPILAPPLAPDLAARLPRAPLTLPALTELEPDALVAAPDPEAWRLARLLPRAHTVPRREALRARAIGCRVAELADVGAHLRRECPWDRAQTAATIVPHTIEEAFEVADAVASGDAGHQADELGDLLFQAVFLAQLLEEQGKADLAEVARGQADKLIARHPHVYGDVRAESAGRVVDLWEARKREERADQGIFHDLPAGLPALALAAKTHKRAAAVGFVFPSVDAALAKAREELEELGRDPGERELGDAVFALVAVARALGADLELALRAAARRFRTRVEDAARLAREAGDDFAALSGPEQLEWYARARDPRRGSGRR